MENTKILHFVTKDHDKEKDEEPEKVEEVKRVPRYFPPRKMPNPFEE